MFLIWITLMGFVDLIEINQPLFHPNIKMHSTDTYYLALDWWTGDGVT